MRGTQYAVLSSEKDLAYRVHVGNPEDISKIERQLGFAQGHIMKGRVQAGSTTVAVYAYSNTCDVNPDGLARNALRRLHKKLREHVGDVAGAEWELSRAKTEFDYWVHPARWSDPEAQLPRARDYAENLPGVVQLHALEHV